MNERHRRDTVLTSQTPYSDPSSKIWGLYLSQAERIDKEHSDSWTANTDGVLVFVRHNYPTSFYCSHPRGTYSDWSFLYSGRYIPRCQLSAFTTQFNRYHKPAAYPNLPAAILKWDRLVTAVVSC
jgi:hypothetical protein